MSKNESVDAASMHPIVHTLGPWKVSRRFDIYEDTQKPGVGGTFIGSTRGNWPLPEGVNRRCEADAKLMAAAPDMLQLITDFAEWDRKHPKTYIHSMNAERALDNLFERAKQIVNEVV